MKNHVKNQHLVPQFLLKNFASRDEAFIWAYDKNEKYNEQNRIKERAIKKVASEKYFYDKNKKDPESSYEYVLQEIENNSAPIIAEIIKTKNIKDISKEDRRTLSLFIVTQILRTKGNLLQCESRTESISKHLEEKWNIKTPDIDSKKVWFSTLQKHEIFKEIIMNKIWVLYESNNSFLISDNPVTLQNVINTNKHRGTLGIDSPGIEIYLPLSPSLTICMFCEKFFEQNGYYIKQIPNEISILEKVENLNFLQIASSDRFIFSHKNDFEFVERTIKFYSLKKMNY